MSIIEKVFKYEETDLSVIKCKEVIWFRGKTLAEVLGYSNTLKAIRTHVDSEDKKEMSELGYKGGAQNGHPFRNVQQGTIYVNESILFALILRSQLESAHAFKRWVTKDVLPSIRKTGRYDYGMNHKYNDSLTFKIENEMDSYKKGYLRGSPDPIINNLHKHYTGFAIEFKNPNGKGILSSDQSMMLQQYQNNGFKTLVSNDYDHIIEQLIEYFRDVRMMCSHCPRRFISPQSLRNHIKSFHKMA